MAPVSNLSILTQIPDHDKQKTPVASATGVFCSSHCAAELLSPATLL
ncbi:hypothetical protein HNR24_002544 [Nesterenkonia jeotgali]|uniref:Uncharacterized protein n=1 Tax=Nesterenkonia jeotgali TaxID=317018 RepID=A0A839FVP5_9MICC|nr:hypothetical protein [Nesterenkonia jeotgali]